MRHRRSGKHLGRNTSSRLALARSLVVGLCSAPNGRIVTTVAKAKWVRGFADSVACRAAAVVQAEAAGPSARVEVVNGRRKLSQILGRRVDVAVVVEAAKARSARVSGGNLRVVRLPGYRIGDAGRSAVLEFVG